MIALLDVNVLIGLVHVTHIHHAPAKRFFQTAQFHGWATCPLTENGALCILGCPGTGHGPDSPTSARLLLRSLLARPGHHFWPDDVSLSDTRLFPALPASKHLTDIYILGLAVKHGGRFATFDESVDASLIPGGPAACLVLPHS